METKRPCDGFAARVRARRDCGLAAALTAPVLAQQGSASLQSVRSARVPAQSVEQDPTKQYPRPPFPPQQPQERPGLAGKMNPRPDHGEKSYQGSGRLVGRRCS